MKKQRKNRVWFLGLLIMLVFPFSSVDAHHKHGHFGGPPHGNHHYCDFHHDYHYYYGPAPVWMPVHAYHTDVRHIYFPAYNVYYDTWRGMYIYMNHGGWVVDVRLPHHLRRVNFARTVSVGLTLHIDRPFTYNTYHIHELSYIAHDSGYGPRYPSRREGGFRDHYYVRTRNANSHGYSKNNSSNNRYSAPGNSRTQREYKGRPSFSNENNDANRQRYENRGTVTGRGNSSGYSNSGNNRRSSNAYESRSENNSRGNSGNKARSSGSGNRYEYKRGDNEKADRSRNNSGSSRRGNVKATSNSRGRGN